MIGENNMTTQNKNHKKTFREMIADAGAFIVDCICDIILWEIFDIFRKD